VATKRRSGGASPVTEQSRVLECHKTMLAESCEEAFRGPDAIILYGGYGRGEGGWVRERDTWRPYNDYDVLVVGGEKPARRDLQKLRASLARDLKIHQVDITWTNRLRLALLRPSIFSYDLKHASTLLRGDDTVLRWVRPGSVGTLPMREAFTLFRTRLWTFLGSTMREDFGKPLADEAARFFRNQMAKATLAAVDVLLLRHGLYHHSYVERVKRVGRLPETSGDDAEWFSWALNEKLHPNGSPLDGPAMLTHYDRTHDLFTRHMLTAISSFLGRPLASVPEVADCFERHWRFRVRRAAKILAKGRTVTRRSRSLDLAQMYLFAAYSPAGIDAQLAQKAAVLLNGIAPEVNADTHWHQLRCVAAQMRLDP
jgi:hypothetical protein